MATDEKQTLGHPPQFTSVLAQILRMTDETYAMDLIRKIEGRFMFRFLTSQSRFDEIRKANAGKGMTDADCFLSVVSDSLSERAKTLFTTARERHGRYDQLLKKVKNQRIPKRARLAKIEEARIRAILEFELEENKGNKNFSFQNGGLTRLTDDFFLLNEYLVGSQSDRLNRLCQRWGFFALSDDNKAEIDKAPADEKPKLLVEKVRPLLEPLWSFFVALCHALQDGENELTATDAYWLGLIDEVIGDSGLMSYRHVAEYQDDPPPPGQGTTAQAAGTPAQTPTG